MLVREDEFGLGIYITDDMGMAPLNTQRNGVFLVFEWIAWPHTICIMMSGFICNDIQGKPRPPIFYNLDIFIGPKLANYDANSRYKRDFKHGQLLLSFTLLDC